MAVKIRLQRHGKKDNAFFHIVVADGRAPRDGKFIEKLGTYNPNTNPATINLNFDKALDWLQKGAQPTDTCRAILSYKGVIYKKHLLGGVKKGALTEAQVEEKFNTWVSQKDGKITTKKDKIASDKSQKAEAQMKAETAKKEAIAAKVAAKSKPAEEVVEASAETAEEATPVAETEAPAVEETPENNTESSESTEDKA
jgi:small subunit ribosomal protein S16